MFRLRIRYWVGQTDTHQIDIPARDDESMTIDRLIVAVTEAANRKLFSYDEALKIQEGIRFTMRRKLRCRNEQFSVMGKSVTLIECEDSLLAMLRERGLVKAS